MQTINQWHNQFKHQSIWTEDIVSYIIDKAELTNSSKIIEIGCGTGAVLDKFPANFNSFGLDINPEYAIFTKKKYDNIIIGNGNTLPIKENTFNLVFCHFLLLWVKSPISILREIKRVAKPGGTIAILAEPDYSNRIDQPVEFEYLGKAQTKSLQSQGANPMIGGQLPTIFSYLNLENVEVGQYSNSKSSRSYSEWELEWEILEFDLKKGNFPEPMKKYEDIDIKARNEGSRKLTIPTHFAIGTKGVQNEREN
jgi:ubiquinone/menaquinone biosynthesis C-methylase UbiE